jgi:transposase-like protein
MTFFEFQNQFPNEISVINYFADIRYKNGIKCNHCGSTKVYHRNGEPKIFDCNDCGNSFSIFSGTIFEKSCTDLRKWFYAIHIFLNGKKGISGLQLQREIGVTYKTAWRMLRQIRLAMGNDADRKLFETVVEIDETYVGGKPRKSNKKDNDNNKRGRGTRKTPVVGILCRDEKKVVAKVALPNKKGKKLTSKQLLSILDSVTKNDTDVISDEFKSYISLDNTEHKHFVINHSLSFAENDFLHTNNIESFWATLKRGIYGIYHHVSIQHLQHYVNEFCFRYNNRSTDMFDLLLSKTIA